MIKKELLNQEKSLIAMCKFLLWLFVFFLICLVGVSNVFAWTNWNGITYDEIGAITNKTDVMIDVSYETEAGAPLPLSVDQLVYTQLKKLYINVDNYNFNANTRYELEIYLPNMQLNNNANSYIVTGYNGESCLVSYSDAIFVDHYPRWDFQCPTATNTISIVIFNSNNQNITEKNNFSWNYSYLYSSITPITNTDANNNNDLITNSNQNADRIIDNQNQNTQDIINNNNQNTQDIIDNQNKNFGTKCIKDLSSNLHFLKLHFNNYMSTATISNSSNFEGAYIDVSNLHGHYINLSFDSPLKKAKYAFTSSTLLNNATTISVFSGQKNDAPYSYTNILIPDNATYLLLETNYQTNLIGNANLQHITIELTEEICTNKLDEQTNAINGLNDSLTDSSPIDMSSLGDTAGWLPAGPIDSIINLPLNFLNNLLVALNGTCQPINIPLPYVNKTLSVPCISTIFNQIDGLPNFWNWVGVITSVLILYRYLLSLYKYYDDLTTLKANFISDFGGAP